MAETTAFDLVDRATEAAKRKAAELGMTPEQTLRYVEQFIERVIDDMRDHQPDLYRRFAAALEAQYSDTYGLAPDCRPSTPTPCEEER